VERWHRPDEADRRIDAWLALRQLLVCSPPLWEAFRDLATELDVRIHTHVAEGTYEVDYAAEHWGKRPAEYLESIGFLGPRVHAAHSILLSNDELDLYARRGVTVAHCPMGNFIIGPPKTPDMVRLGIPVGIGSDGASNGSIDLFQAMHVSQVALQSHFGTPWHIRTVLSAEDLLAMATIGGARALGLQADLGSLEAGKRADLLLINPSRPDLQPIYDPLFTAARVATGADVETVIVAGRVVMKDGHLTTVDEEQLGTRLGRQWPAIMDRFERLVA
jgi:5-methylthioadenosine/S-adenosylhomocysteine deaminase